MATLFISEFEEMGVGVDGREMQAPVAPPIATQTVTFTTSTASNAFNARTRLVMVLSTAAAAVKFAGTPTAVATDIAIPGEVPMYFSVPPNSSLKIAAITR